MQEILRIPHLSFIMEKCFPEKALDIFTQPARIIITGSSNSGKSFLVGNLIKKYESRFTHIIISGGVDNHPLRQDPVIGKKLFLHKDIIDPLSCVDFPQKPYNILYVIDDLFDDAVKNKIVADCFTKGRHDNISVILITQNLFYASKYSRNISLNASHFILLRVRDVTQIEVLGRQMFGGAGGKDLVKVYKNVVLTQPYAYLLLDACVYTPQELQIRTNIVGESPGEIIYTEWQSR